MKRCATCKNVKCVAEFYIQRSGKHRGKPTSECRDCVRARSSAYYMANKEKARLSHREWVARNPDRVAFHKAKSAYGITKEHYDSIPTVCVICGSTSRSVLDHSHQTGRIRGRLCAACNKGIGFFRDNPCLLLRASDYVLGLAKTDIFEATYEPVHKSKQDRLDELDEAITKEQE